MNQTTPIVKYSKYSQKCLQKHRRIDKNELVCYIAASETSMFIRNIQVSPLSINSKLGVSMTQHSSIVVHTTKLNKKTQQEEPITDVAAIKFPCAFERGEDAEYLRKIHTGTVGMINYCFGLLKDKFFQPLTFVVNGEPRIITLFELFAPHQKLGTKDPVTKKNSEITFGGSPVNFSIDGYPCREIFNKKTPIIGVDSAQLIETFQTNLKDVVGEDVTVPLVYMNEVIYNVMDSMLKSFVRRKLNACSSGKDSTWSNSCYEVAKELAPTDIEAEPEMPKEWKTRFTCKLITEKTPLPPPSDMDTFYMAYRLAMEKYMNEVLEHFPTIKRNSLMKVPSAIVDVDHTDYDRYYDTSFKLYGVPSTKKMETVKLRMRTRSGHSTNYYPESLKDAIKNKPQVSIKFPEDATAEDMCLPDSCKHQAKHNPICTIATEHPSVEIEFNEEVFENEGVGIDLNLAEFLLNTTVKPSEITDYVDFVEALAAFYKERPDNVIFTDRAPDRLVREIKYIVNHASDKNRTAAFVFLAGVRDGNTVADQHNWHPAKDFLSTFFKWMLDRKNADGTPLYNEFQRKVIAMTRTIRNEIRLIMTLVHRRKIEQSIWDRSHDPLTEKFTDSEFAIQNLKEFNKRVADLEQTIQQVIAESLLNRIPKQRSQFYAMEDVNLIELRNESHVVSLYRTAQKDWGMTGGKLSVDRPTNTVTFVCKDQTVKPEVESTEYWKVKSVTTLGDTTTVVAEPTERFIRQVIQDQVDGSIKKILRVSGYKHFVELRCLKLGKLMVAVNPKHTSQLCHVCKDPKRIAKKSERLSKEACAEKGKNYRDNRHFWCGNPDCPCHGVDQNADENAAFNILHKSYAKR